MREYYSVREIAEILKIHEKTVQRYIREGRMRASKIGKSWRVTPDELSRYVEQMKCNTNNDEASGEGSLTVKGSLVVDISGLTEYRRERVTASLNAALMSKPREYGKTSMSIQYIEPEGVIRVMLWGGVEFLKVMLGLIENIQAGDE